MDTYHKTIDFPDPGKETSNPYAGAWPDNPAGDIVVVQIEQEEIAINVLKSGAPAT